MARSTRSRGDARHDGPDNLDRHGWPDVGQINWEDAENAAPASTAPDQSRPWHELSANWRGEHEHHNAPDAHHQDETNSADGVHEARDGSNHEQQTPPADHVGEHEDHRGPGHHPVSASGDQHQSMASEHHNEANAAEGAHETEDGENHEHGPQSGDNADGDAEHGGRDGPGHGGEAEANRGPGHDAEVACDDSPVTPASDPQAAAEDEHQAVATAHDNTSEANDAEGVHETQDGVGHEHENQGQPQAEPDGNAAENADEHGGHRGPGHEGEHHNQGETPWNDTFVWSDMSTWGDTSPNSHEGHVPDMDEEMDMDFDNGSSGEDNSGPSAHAHGGDHGPDGADDIVCPAPATDWHALL